MREIGIKSIVDIVLNHTADDSSWILEHPEATYNTENCPQLYTAWLLDQALAQFNKDLLAGKIRELRRLNLFIRSAQDVNDIMNHIKHSVIKPLKLEEYFQCDTALVEKDLVAQIDKLTDEQIEEFRAKFGEQKLLERSVDDVISEKFCVNQGTGPSPF